MVRQFVKYNPAFLESEKLVENFVVRQTDLQMIIKIVRENTAASNQHVLVIGPRGSGKTTLVRRVSADIVRDEALGNAWYPLVFAEESYNALSAADFWLESLFHLAEQTRDPQRMMSYHELRRDPDEKRLAQRSLGQLLDYADSIGKRILLIVENLDMLLSEFSSDTEAWALRHTLMNEPRLMLLATATARFEAIDHPAKAMFEMFRIHDLRPLNDKECNTIWELVTGAPLPGLQIRPIRILTGGNARLIALIARFGEKRSFRELLENLIDLIDEHTDYFKSHLDNMAPMERKVYLSLAELWKQSSAKEIAEVARLDVNTTSAYLKRLASKGKVIVENEGKRKKWYSISEGIYNIYYLMRRRGGPSARVKAAVRFMVGLYEPIDVAKLLIDEVSCLNPEHCKDHMIALGDIIYMLSGTQLSEIAKSLPVNILESPYLDKKVKMVLLLLRYYSNEDLEQLLGELNGQVASLVDLLDELKTVNRTDMLPLLKKFERNYKELLSKYSLFHAIIFLGDTGCKIGIERGIDIFVELAAQGQEEQALQMLTGSGPEKELEPLIVGLQLYCGQEVRTAPEILEVAKDVVKRIKERNQEIKAQKSSSSEGQ